MERDDSFCRRGKLGPRFIGPLKIVAWGGKVAYRLESPSEWTWEPEDEMRQNYPELFQSKKRKKREIFRIPIRIARLWEIGSFSLVNRRIVVKFGQRLHDSQFSDLT
ncbi:hypothetical protein OSB04_un000665 [Centaurea solstitialis]|uniref:Tf2-1-like SH3-like domain-containing protein n=1 Tax=Centaurea solstitialis TaxID=347529 RepID=A0AA38W3D8_9ASTR|nr:hypothetical protein OSB04_un000665 [Centaurea solstitialis]